MGVAGNLDGPKKPAFQLLPPAARALNRHTPGVVVGNDDAEGREVFKFTLHARSGSVEIARQACRCGAVSNLQGSDDAQA